MNNSIENIRIGTAGWNYKDWYGIVYPKQAGKGFKELDYLANFFDTVEINSSFYRPPHKHMSYAWIKKVARTGGTTEAALRVFEETALHEDIVAGAQAALDRARELGK